MQPPDGSTYHCVRNSRPQCLCHRDCVRVGDGVDRVHTISTRASSVVPSRRRLHGQRLVATPALLTMQSTACVYVLCNSKPLVQGWRTQCNPKASLPASCPHMRVSGCALMQGCMQRRGRCSGSPTWETEAMLTRGPGRALSHGSPPPRWTLGRCSASVQR